MAVLGTGDLKDGRFRADVLKSNDCRIMSQHVYVFELFPAGILLFFAR